MYIYICASVSRATIPHLCLVVLCLHWLLVILVQTKKLKLLHFNHIVPIQIQWRPTTSEQIGVIPPKNVTLLVLGMFSLQPNHHGNWRGHGHNRVWVCLKIQDIQVPNLPFMKNLHHLASWSQRFSSFSHHKTHRGTWLQLRCGETGELVGDIALNGLPKAWHWNHTVVLNRCYIYNYP